MRIQAHAGHRLALCGVGSDELPRRVEALGDGFPIHRDASFSMGDGRAMRRAEQGVLAQARGGLDERLLERGLLSL